MNVLAIPTTATRMVSVPILKEVLLVNAVLDIKEMELHAWVSLKIFPWPFHSRPTWNWAIFDEDIHQIWIMPIYVFYNLQYFQTWMNVPTMMMTAVLTAVAPTQWEVFHVLVIQDLKVMVKLALVNIFLPIQHHSCQKKLKYFLNFNLVEYYLY